MSVPRWAAVVVNYEAGPLLVESVQSLLADTSAGVPEVVVVDNGSTDGSVTGLRAALPNVRVVTSERNVGYAAAANQGIAATAAPVVAVCNCDLRVEPGTAASMLARLDAERDVGAVGPTIRNPDGTRYPSARSIPSVGDAVGHGVFGLFWAGNPFTRRYRELDADPTRARDVGFVSGAAIWLRRTALDDVGGWDPRYFMYVEDVDLCWRLRGAGWRVVYEPGGEVAHVQGASTERHPYRMLVEHHRSLLRFAAKRWRGWRRVFLLPAACYLALRAGLTAGIRAVSPRRSRRGVRRATG
jgi:N-acetylglucosaminyl-diphospho-decaprenol L-rhamnosyltransferase